jgi:hypothetical protein
MTTSRHVLRRRDYGSARARFLACRRALIVAVKALFQLPPASSRGGLDSVFASNRLDLARNFKGRFRNAFAGFLSWRKVVLLSERGNVARRK